MKTLAMALGAYQLDDLAVQDEGIFLRLVVFLGFAWQDTSVVLSNCGAYAQCLVALWEQDGNAQQGLEKDGLFFFVVFANHFLVVMVALVGHAKAIVGRNSMVQHDKWGLVGTH